jgi:hypothetical protein
MSTTYKPEYPVLLANTKKQTAFIAGNRHQNNISIDCASFPTHQF